MLLTDYKYYRVRPLDAEAQQDDILTVRRLGLQDYEPIWRSMQYLANHPGNSRGDEIWLLSHKPIFTLGQAGLPEHVLDRCKIPLVQTDRGGQVTYHGPGQLVVYLLLDVRKRKMGVRNLVDLIENSIVETLGDFGITGHTRPNAPGVYVEEAKLAALGLRIRNGRSYHGLSLNIDMDLSPYKLINPCGFQGLEVTQLADLVAQRDQLMQRTSTALTNTLLRHLQYQEIIN